MSDNTYVRPEPNCVIRGDVNSPVLRRVRSIASRYHAKVEETLTEVLNTQCGCLEESERRATPAKR